MKTILMLIVGLMLAGCGSMETMFVIVLLHRERNADQEMLWRLTQYALALDDFRITWVA